MQAFNIWHKFDLRGTKVIPLVIAMIFILGPVMAQDGEIIHNPNYDARKTFTYGFTVGFHNSAYKLNYSEAFTSPSMDSVHSILPKWSLGFSLGFIINARVAEYLDIRLTPKVSFYEFKLEYNYLNAPQRVETEEATAVELPVLFKYKSARRKNTRMYLIGGFTPAFEASGTSDLEENADLLQIERFNFMAEFGFGLDLYYPLFKFSPEIRFAKGLLNVLATDKPNDLSRGIDRLSTNVISLYLHFQ